MQQYKVHLEYCTFGRYRVDDVVLVVQAASPILAAEKAERLAADLHGGELDWWFAYEVEGHDGDWSSGLVQCDPCGRIVPRDETAKIVAYGIDTVACAACRGGENADR